MAVRPLMHIHIETRTLRSICTAVLLGLSVSACGHAGTVAGLVDSMTDTSPTQVSGQSELQKALVYWGQEYAKSPGNAKAAVAFSKNLKASGQKKKALSVLQQASMYNSADKGIASEYGRMALDLGQTKLAQKVLRRALDPNKPDWRVLSALGTSFAKSGDHAQAQNYFQQALNIAPGQSSIVNNLALSYALDGKAEQAEQHLRKAVAMGGNGDKVRQNLALVLGVQGRYNDAKSVGLKDLTKDGAQQNVAFLQDMVNKPEAGMRPPVLPTGPALASADPSSTVPGFRGAQVVANKPVEGTWNTKLASSDWAPISLTPKR